MAVIYPIFTDGKNFYHSNSYYPIGCRFAYFSKLQLKEWARVEKPQLTEEKAKIVYEHWEKKQ